MHVIVVGCGRVGSAVAHQLIDSGHTVCVIDRRASAFRRLGTSFGGDTRVGVGFDRDVLRAAGITADSAVAAVTSGDNSNILIARVAREVFGVERVIARIYDPARASVYERLGIATVATVAWTTDRVMRRLLPDSDLPPDWTDPTGTFGLFEKVVSAADAGITTGEFENRHDCTVATTIRNGAAARASRDVLIQEGDVVHVITRGGAS